jgi:hypothetical protein
MVGCSPSFDLNANDGGRARLVLGNAAAPTGYCTPKTNSAGCVPHISYTGCASLSIGDNFHVVAQNVLPNALGMLIWSQSPNSVPFFGGTLCVGSPIRRTQAQAAGNQGTGACIGTYDIHLSQAYLASWGLAPGMQIHAQFWSRDNGFAPPDNIGLTGGLKVTVLP